MLRFCFDLQDPASICRKHMSSTPWTAIKREIKGLKVTIQYNKNNLCRICVAKKKGVWHKTEKKRTETQNKQGVDEFRSKYEDHTLRKHRRTGKTTIEL